MFAEFIEKSYENYKGDENRVSQFMNLIRKLKLNWKVEIFDLLNNPVIRNSLNTKFYEKQKMEIIHNHENPIIIDINKYLVKYYLKMTQLQYPMCN